MFRSESMPVFGYGAKNYCQLSNPLKAELERLLNMHNPMGQMTTPRDTRSTASPMRFLTSRPFPTQTPFPLTKITTAQKDQEFVELSNSMFDQQEKADPNMLQNSKGIEEFSKIEGNKAGDAVQGKPKDLFNLRASTSSSSELRTNSNEDAEQFICRHCNKDFRFDTNNDKIIIHSSKRNAIRKSIQIINRFWNIIDLRRPDILSRLEFQYSYLLYSVSDI